ncbi:MAG: threonine/serine exporter family protein [Gemmatimonadaceae bacterium]|nr:threonine/serine exporter family protein [Gemmatimonadaceae bacterium]
MTTSPAFHDATRFLLRLAHGLHASGFPAHRLEVTLAEAAEQLKVPAQFFSTPTSIFAAFGPPEEQRTHLIRVVPGATDLGRLAGLDRIARDVMAGRTSVSEGVARIDALSAEPPRWSAQMTLIAFVLVSVAVATFLHVRAIDLGIAAVLGLVAGALSLWTARHPAWNDVGEPLIACAVATLAIALATITGSAPGYATIIAGLVVLLPGMQFTTGVIELSTRHLSSGTARLSGALVTFLGLGFGVALGVQIGAWLGVTAVGLGWQWALPNPAVPSWTEWIGVLIAPLCFTVLLKARGADAPWIIGASVVAFATAQLAGRTVGEQLAAFLGAFMVSALATLVARWRGASSQVMTVPGLLILVPGSIGLRSVASFSARQVVTGVETAFQVALVGISLAAGLLAGRAVTSHLRWKDRRARTGEYPVLR